MSSLIFESKMAPFVMIAQFKASHLDLTLVQEYAHAGLGLEDFQARFTHLALIGPCLPKSVRELQAAARLSRPSA